MPSTELQRQLAHRRRQLPVHGRAEELSLGVLVPKPPVIYYVPVWLPRKNKSSIWFSMCTPHCPRNRLVEEKWSWPISIMKNPILDCKKMKIAKTKFMYHNLDICSSRFPCVDQVLDVENDWKSSDFLDKNWDCTTVGFEHFQKKIYQLLPWKKRKKNMIFTDFRRFF